MLDVSDPVVGTIELGIEQTKIIVVVDGKPGQKEWIGGGLNGPDGGADAAVITGLLQPGAKNVKEAGLSAGEGEWIGKSIDSGSEMLFDVGFGIGDFVMKFAQ